MDTILLVVIDQLGWQDIRHFTDLQSVLGDPVCVEVPYFPTVTETAHASLAFSALPEGHGVIGGEWFTEVSKNTLGLCGISQAGGPLKPVTIELVRRHVECFVVAGKPKVAQLLFPISVAAPDLPALHVPEEMVRVTLDRNKSGDIFFKIDEAKTFPVPSPNRTPSDENDPLIDTLLIEQASLLLNKVRQPHRITNCLLFLGLPMVDRLGHRHPRDSETMCTHFKCVDKELAGFVKSNLDSETAVIVTGDHGWRPTDTVIWVEDGKFRRLRRGGVPEVLGMPDAIRPDENGVPAVVCDGGTVRLWVAPGEEAAAATQLRELLTPDLSDVYYGTTLTNLLNRFNSNHKNWGGVVGIAAYNVALCKRDWITKGQEPCVPRVPHAEHGTLNPDDRLVPLWRTRNGPAPDVVHTTFLQWVLERF